MKVGIKLPGGNIEMAQATTVESGKNILRHGGNTHWKTTERKC